MQTHTGTSSANSNSNCNPDTGEGCTRQAVNYAGSTEDPNLLEIVGNPVGARLYYFGDNGWTYYDTTPCTLDLSKLPITGNSIEIRLSKPGFRDFDQTYNVYGLKADNPQLQPA